MTAPLTIRVTPNSSRDEVAGEVGGAIKIRLRAPAVEGKANAALIRFLADALDVRPSAVRICRGETGRTKTVEIAGIEGRVAASRLLVLAQKR